MTVDRRGHYLDRLPALIGAETYRYRHPAGPERPPTVPESPRVTRRVVVGVDGSVSSVTALRWAAEEAARREVPLLAVAAYRRDRLPPGQLVGVTLVRPHEHHRPLGGWCSLPLAVSV
jgi:hypothetical protein